MMHTQIQVDTGQRIVYDLRATLLAHLQALPLRHHVTAKTADSVYRLESDAYCVNDLVIGGVFPLAMAVLKLAVMFVILVRLDVTLALLSLDGGAVPLRLPALLLAEDDRPGRARQGARVGARSSARSRSCRRSGRSRASRASGTSWSGSRRPAPRR